MKSMIRILSICTALIWSSMETVTADSSPIRSDWKILVRHLPVKTGEKPFDLRKTSGWVSDNPGYEQAAAVELAELLKRLTGQTVEVIEVGEKQSVSYAKYIAVGQVARDLGATPPKSLFGIDGSTVEVAP